LEGRAGSGKAEVAASTFRGGMIVDGSFLTKGRERSTKYVRNCGGFVLGYARMPDMRYAKEYL
jgi:hypothetical protein